MSIAGMQSQRALSETSQEPFHVFQLEKVLPGRGCLLQIYPARASSEMIRLPQQRVIFGRDPVCDVNLPDKAVSRSHAQFESDDDGYELVDLGSTNGTYIDDQLVLDRRRLNGGELIRMGGTIFKFMSAIDEEAHYHAVVHDLMTRDPLTNCFNRAYLLPALEKLLNNSQRNLSSLSVILLDIDFFKRINDTHGHLTGDEVLRTFCERVRRCLRDTDILARLGGEEFVVVTSATDRTLTRKIADRIRSSIESPCFETQAGLLHVTCSLGIAWTDGTLFDSVDELLRDADQWLYKAKNSGRNRICGPAESNC